MQTYHANYPIRELAPHPKNPRQGDIGAIHDSITHNGWYGAIIAQQGTGYILAGNHRIQAAGHAGMTNVPVIFVECDEPTATRIMLADNRTSDLATNDESALAELLAELNLTSTIDGSGYDSADLDELVGNLSRDPIGTQTTTCPECGHEWAANG